MDVESAHQHLTRNLLLDRGRFFAGGRNLSLGVGQIYLGIRFPFFDDDEQIFVTAQGAAYVLTHECDVDLANARIFNTHVLVCPIIDFRDFVIEFTLEHSEEYLVSFLADLGRRNVSRVAYIPHWLPHLPFGGLLYLNRITHTHVHAFHAADAQMICTVTNYGLREIDYALVNHLLRPKVEALPL